ncbi:DnaJ-domain-containing protein [Linderina pennispora]|uniref:DnaJ-domain-containing protein n=1 Tax=Linderina pennispora TaxID=61395 RepID=A0A1Y1VZZ1_9FUNG|nr:DnaJ-domain-containing protein [Linderina pennispora]ORX66831.1 DnaJ-domain-containing protein [Linderina pennispora]
MGDLFGVVGWLFLPKFASDCVLQGAHWVLARVAPGKVPAAHSAAYNLHRRLSYAVVIMLYLFYTLYSTEKSLGTNYYQLLGVSPSGVSSAQLKRNFRNLSLALHPDKNTGNEMEFIQVQEAYRVLSTPTLQFVYDRAGASALACQTCKSANDYLLAAVPRRLGVYGAFVFGNVILQVFRFGVNGIYWRYLAIGAFAVLELLIMTGKTTPVFIGAMQFVVRQRTGFEIAQIPAAGQDQAPGGHVPQHRAPQQADGRVREGDAAVLDAGVQLAVPQDVRRAAQCRAGAD